MKSIVNVLALPARAVLPALDRFIGPVLGKELRVTSRRRRHYILRVGYLLVLAGLIALVWRAIFPSFFNQNSIARMAEGGRVIVLTVAWFQFLVSQLLAIVLLSRAVSDEINKRTLGALMSTPIKSLQIVTGKLLGGLAQLLMLLCVALPLLAMLRMLGGIDWSMVIGSFCLTVTTSLFLGSLSLFFSIFNRQSFMVMLMTLVAAAILYLGLPLLAVYLTDKFSFASVSNVAIVLAYVNPYVAMELLSDRGMGGSLGWSARLPAWEVCSALSLVATGVMVLISAVRVRKAALRQAVGDVHARGPKVRAGSAAVAATTSLPGPSASGQYSGRIRRVWDNAILWREFQTPLLPRKALSITMLALALLALLIAYIIAFVEGELTHHAVFSVPLFLFGAVVAVLTSATSITSEKEARTWQLLLLTDRSSGAIVWAKALGVMRRCLAPFVLLIGHQLVFSFINLPPITLAFTLVIVLGFVAFMTGSGLYFSARLKSSTSAAVANLALALAIWLAVPFVLAMLESGSRWSSGGYWPQLARVALTANPVVQVGVVAEVHNDDWRRDGAGRRTPHALAYNWPTGYEGVGNTALYVGCCSGGYAGAGLLLGYLASRRLRRGHLLG